MNPATKVTVTKNDLDKAFTNNELILYYQPQFNLNDTHFDGVEALVRWKHASGILQPADFLSAIEAEDMIIQLGEWVLHHACLQSRAWIDKGLMPVRMAVNICGEHFQTRDFVEKVLVELQQSDLNPELLELELTEDMIIHADDDLTHENIRRLRARGIMIALDDFGTGFSSISHLKKIQVDRIKIDRTYIQNIHKNKDDAAIVKAIISLAAGLNLKSLAEGIESHHQLAMLIDYGCHEAQGFYFSDPLTAQEAEDFLRLYQANPFTFKYPE